MHNYLSMLDEAKANLKDEELLDAQWLLVVITSASPKWKGPKFKLLVLYSGTALRHLLFLHEIPNYQHVGEYLSYNEYCDSPLNSHLRVSLVATALHRRCHRMRTIEHASVISRRY